jgi:hypothetical protein
MNKRCHAPAGVALAVVAVLALPTSSFAQVKVIISGGFPAMFVSHMRMVPMTQTIYEAAGGRQVFVNLARAWHARCLADAVVSHAFSHGYHPQHIERLAAYWAEALGGRRITPNRWAMRPVWCGCIRGTASTWRWTSEHRPASRRPSMMPDFPTILA